MAVVITLDALSPHRVGLCKASYGTLAMDNSCPLGGEPITANLMGFHHAIYAVEFSGDLLGTQLHWDYATQSLISTPMAMQREILNPAQALRDLIAGAADVSTFQMGVDTYVLGFSSVVVTLTAIDTIAAVMSLEKRDADGAAGGIELAEITYTDADAVGEVDSVFVGAGDVGGAVDTAAALATPYLVAAGETLALVHKTAGTDSGAADGDAICHVWIAIADPGETMPAAHDMSGVTAARFTAFGW